jgi:hypothetical protein
MDLIETRADLIANVETLRRAVGDQSNPYHKYATELVRHGVCFVVTGTRNEPFFSPSRFVGYLGITPAIHQANVPKLDGRITNKAIGMILGGSPLRSAALEIEYERACSRLGIESGKAPFNLKRKFWDIR